MAKELLLYRTFGDTRFSLVKISFNKTSGWEESKIEGQYSEKEGIIELKPVICRIFATSAIGEKWIITRAFECDHLSFKLDKKTSSLAPAFELSGQEEFRPAHSGNSGMVIGKGLVWSQSFRYIGKVGGVATSAGIATPGLLKRSDSVLVFEKLDVATGDIVSIP